MGASKPIGTTLDGSHNHRQAGIKLDDPFVNGDSCSIDDEKAAVIGRSKCILARKLEKGTKAAGGTAVQGWGAGAAPLPDTPLSAADELPPPLLDGGQGKICSTDNDGELDDRGTDDGCRTDDDGRERVAYGGNLKEDLTAIRDRASPCKTSRPLHLNRVDLPRSETSPTHSSVVPPSGEQMTVMPVKTTVNGVHPPPRTRCPGQGRGCGGGIPSCVTETYLHRQARHLARWTVCARTPYVRREDW